MMRPPQTTSPPPSRGRRWIRRLLFALILFGALYLARGPLLRGVAAFLVVEDPVRQADALVLMSGDRLYERGADLYHAGVAQRVLVVHGPPGRLHRLGILPDDVTLTKRELGKYDVPDTAIEVLTAEKSGVWNVARRLRDWLNEHPEARLLVLCDRFSSRRTRCLFEQELGGLSARVTWRALPDRRFDETNWHRNKAGVLTLFGGYLTWGHVRIYGDALGDQPEWNPDQYQNSLP